MTVVHPITRAWITTGDPVARTAARNYDEFADDAEITSIIASHPHSALGVEMPHRAPDSLGDSFTGALPAAAARLARAKQIGAYRPAGEVVVLYRITGGAKLAAGEEGSAGEAGSTPSGGTRGVPAAAYGMFCAVDTDQISTSADEPGLVIRNEDVFIEKVRERVELAGATGHLLSPVLLLQTARGAELHAALAEACAAAGEPAATDVDHVGRTHAVWPLPPGPTAARLCALAGGGELVVADGNHRSLAAQIGRLPRFLAVVTTPASVTIQPYHRLLTEVPANLADAGVLRARGLDVEELAEAPPDRPERGTAHLYRAGRWCRMTLPIRPAGNVVDNLDHTLVERVLLRDAFGLEPGDKRIGYVGGDYPVRWLCDEVDAGRAELAIVIAPVTVADFVEVNLDRLKMPRKSTWFTPKARAGLVLAELG